MGPVTACTDTSCICIVRSISISSWAPSQYPERCLFVRSRKVSKPRDWYFKLSYRFEICQAHRQHCCRSACQILERSDNFKYKSRGFETLRDLTKRRLFGYWDGAQFPHGPSLAILQGGITFNFTYNDGYRIAMVLESKWSRLNWTELDAEPLISPGFLSQKCAQIKKINRVWPKSNQLLSGQDTWVCQISWHSVHAFFRECLETPRDSRAEDNPKHYAPGA